MHIALIPTDGATVVSKQIHDHEVEAYAQTYDVHVCNEDGSTTQVAGPTFAASEPETEHDGETEHEESSSDEH